jgi:hypothetical protein
MRDIAAAVAARLDELIPISTIKSCLSREAQSASGCLNELAGVGIAFGILHPAGGDGPNLSSPVSMIH